jgi:hypothetical protein
MMDIQVDIATRQSDDGSALAVFLLIPDECHRTLFENFLFDLGGTYVSYPQPVGVTEVEGRVVLTDMTISIRLGELTLEGLIESPTGQEANQAWVFVAPAMPGESGGEEVLLGAVVPLEVLSLFSL